MKRSIARNIGYKKERVVLSDVLPYEVPPFFSNRYFYRFIVNNKVSLFNDELRFKKDPNNILEKIIRILFGINKSLPINSSNKDYDCFEMKSEKYFVTIPFKFKIKHKENHYRELVVIHPINQLSLVSFYDKYKYSILNGTNLSRFSLRKPCRVASLKYYKDSTNKRKKSETPEIEIIETNDKEYSSLKTFFSYKKYGNIYKFYESYDYQRAEQRFDKLLKCDLSRCFDSIYTHSLPWALANKKIVKDNVPLSKNTFAGKFDEIMQRMNYNETNGIVIGPEFSRIFAELILQKIDKNIEQELYRKGYKFKEDYEIHRYVDDYFIFYSDEKIKDEIFSICTIKLQEFNLFINDAKTEIYSKPIITNITIAKEKIRELVEHAAILQFINNNESIGVLYHSAKDLITNYKLILADTGTSYKDLQNYFLSIIFNRIKKMIKCFQREEQILFDLYIKRNSPIVVDKENIEKEIAEQQKRLKTFYSQLYKSFIEIIDLVFFIYIVQPRVSYSIKVCHILFRIIDFIKNQEKMKQCYMAKTKLKQSDDLSGIAFDFDKKHIIFKKIYDKIIFVFNKNKSLEYAEIETLYLLPIINELGHHYDLPEKLLIEHFNILKDSGTPNYAINYFTLISILYHIRKNSTYNNLRNTIKEIIIRKFITFEARKAEDVFLLIDVLNCPYVGYSENEIIEFRRKILDEIKFFDKGLSNVQKDVLIKNITQYHSSWFYKWEENNLGIELNTKRGHDVY